MCMRMYIRKGKGKGEIAESENDTRSMVPLPKCIEKKGTSKTPVLFFYSDNPELKAMKEGGQEGDNRERKKRNQQKLVSGRKPIKPISIKKRLQRFFEVARSDSSRSLFCLVSSGSRRTLRGRLHLDLANRPRPLKLPLDMLPWYVWIWLPGSLGEWFSEETFGSVTRMP